MNVAVYDFGTARVKLTITFSQNNSICIKKYKVETGLGKLFENSSKEEIINSKDKLKRSILELCSYTNGINFDKKICVVTEVFRNFPELLEELNLYSSIIGKPKILSGKEEGEIFYRNIKNLISLKDFVLLDVGGGSVQIVWENNSKIEVLSLPIGTYRLQNLYQLKKQLLTNEESKIIENEIFSILEQSGKKISTNNIVLGSNCMENLFLSLEKTTKIDLMKDNNLIAMSSILNDFMIDKSYEKQKPYFPENENFMYGADKLFIITLKIAEFVNAKRVLPTNESLSSSLARLSL